MGTCRGFCPAFDGRAAYRLNTPLSRADCRRDISTVRPPRSVTTRPPVTPTSTLSIHFKLTICLRPARKNTAASSCSSSVFRERRIKGGSLPNDTRV